MGKNRGAAASNKRKEQAKSKYNQLTTLVDQVLKASTQNPSAKELENSCNILWDLTEQIRVIEAEDSPPVEQGQSGVQRREYKLNAFMAWCKDNGVQCDKVEVATFDGLGFGVRATQKIQHHDVFMSIPKSMMLMVDTEVSSIGQLLKTDPIVTQMPNIALALHLLSERFKGSSSHWKTYIDALPDVYDTSLYFSPAEIALLKGSSTHEQSIQMQRNIARQYAYFWTLFMNQSNKYPSMAKRFTFDLYRWAVSTVMTRQNIIPHMETSGDVAERKKVGRLALIPLWDMCNHKQGEMLTDYDDSASECLCYANDACEPGEQVFICYGTRANSDFLVHNGFVYKGNPNNTVQLKIGFAKTDSLMEMKRAVLSQQSGMPREAHAFHLGESSRSTIPDNLMSFLRVFHASQEELQALLDSKEQVDKVELISEENDRKCWSFLKVRCSLLLRTYYTGWDDTETLDALNANHVSMAKQQITEEKETLSNIIDLCDSKLTA